jgi:hypothetical protein
MFNKAHFKAVGLTLAVLIAVNKVRALRPVKRMIS